MLSLTAATFNARYGTAADGPNDWEHRWALFGQTVRTLAADVLCLQECLPFQADHARYVVREYEWAGVSRHDGRRSGGEMVPVFWRADRFTLIDAGHFWLSPDPHVPGGKAWGSPYPRMATWVALRPKVGLGPVFTVVNTHFDYESAVARLNSARLLHRRLAALGTDMPIILAGDFNSTDGDPPYLTLRADRLDLEDGLIDAYRAAHPAPDPATEGTFHDFTGTHGGRRIDLILVSRHWQVTAARIDRTSRDGQYPSDHFPVVADLRLPNG